MPNQFRQRRRNQRWRMNRQIKDRRRLNVFLVERRVAYLEGRQEVLALDIENTHDLMSALESKVQTLLDEKRKREAEIESEAQSIFLVRLGRWLRDVLTSKGNP